MVWQIGRTGSTIFITGLKEKYETISDSGFGGSVVCCVCGDSIVCFVVPVRCIQYTMKKTGMQALIDVTDPAKWVVHLRHYGAKDSTSVRKSKVGMEVGQEYRARLLGNGFGQPVAPAASCFFEAVVLSARSTLLGTASPKYKLLHTEFLPQGNI